MRVLLTGGSGMVGGALLRLAPAKIRAKRLGKPLFTLRILRHRALT